MPGGGWTDQRDQALDFEHSLRALSYIRSLGLRNVQILLRFNRVDLDVVLSAN
jgi:hypothetical protein